MGIRQATFEAEKPGDIEFTLHITMPLKDWKDLQKQLGGNWPSWELSGKINDMVAQARKTYYPEHEPDSTP